MQSGGSFPNNQLDMSEADQAEDGIVVKKKRFDFETYVEIELSCFNVLLPLHHNAA